MVTVRRAVALVMTAAYCVYMARRPVPRRFLRHLLLALFVAGAASLAYHLAGSARMPSSTPAINTGSWKGVYGHKAILGRIAAIAVTVAV